MIEIKYIVEYKCEEMPNIWAFFWGADNESTARKQLEEAKRRDGISEARIRVELIQSRVLEEWKRGNTK